MSTPHIQARKDEIAKLVIMPGDPLRAKLFAETYLEKPKLINEIRGMLGYTGTYKGKRVTVMGHGMGLDSIGIYSYELYTEYDVDTIIRFGSCGSYNPNVDIFDVIVAKTAYSESNYGEGFGNFNREIDATLELVELTKEIIDQYKFEKNKKFLITKVNSSQWFYKTENLDLPEKFVKMGIDVVEMESFALYSIAKALNKKALTILTVSDNIVKHEYTTAEQRRSGFVDMFKILLQLIERI